MKKVIYHFEEDGELDVLVDPEAVSSSFLVPWKWLGDFQALVNDDESKYSMIGDCYGRISGKVVNGKIHGPVLLWHYCFNRKGCHHELCEGILVSNGSDGKMIRRNNWVCRMVFETGKLVGNPKKYSVVMKRYRCRRIWRVFFSTLPMSRNSLKCCAQWWGVDDEASIPVIVEWKY